MKNDDKFDYIKNITNYQLSKLITYLATYCIWFFSKMVPKAVFHAFNLIFMKIIW